MSKMHTILRYIGCILALSVILSCFAACKSESDNDGEKAEITTAPDTDSSDPIGSVTEPKETRPNQETEPEETLPDTYQLAVVNDDVLIVRNGPGEDHDAIRKLNKGDTVRVYQQQTVKGIAWGNVGDGWICLDGILWADEQERADEMLKSQMTGSWYLLGEDSAEIWTFTKTGDFTYDFYILDTDGPGSFNESNDQWCGGEYKIENGQLKLTFSQRIDSSRYLTLCGTKYYQGDTAELSASVVSDTLTMKDSQTQVFQRGDINTILELRDTPTEEDKALLEQLVGSWHQLYDDGAEIWTFTADGRFSYDVYIFLTDEPGSFGESNDQWCGGSYKVQDGKLYMTFSDRIQPTGFVMLCGSKYYKDGKATLSISISDNELTLQGKSSTTFAQGDIYAIMEDRNAASSADQALLEQLVGSWYTDTGDHTVFRAFTFQNDGKFVHTIYEFSDSENYTEANDQFCNGTYSVKNGTLIMEFNGYMSSAAEIPLGGVSYKKGDTASLSISVSGSSLKLSGFQTTSLTKGGLAEIKALVKENQPDTPVTDTRILGEWRIVTEIDTENLSLRVGSRLSFSADGTFTGSLSEKTKYFYNPQTGELEYDISQPGAGGYYYWGTYTFDGTTLTMTETGNEYDEPYMSTVTCTVSFSGDTMVQTDKSGIKTTYYPLSWDEIGAYFFGSAA